MLFIFKIIKTSSSSDASNQDNNQANDATSSANSNEIDSTEPTNVLYDFDPDQQYNFLECAINYYTLSEESKDYQEPILVMSLYRSYESGEKSFDSEDETGCAHFLTDSTG